MKNYFGTNPMNKSFYKQVDKESPTEQLEMILKERYLCLIFSSIEKTDAS